MFTISSYARIIRQCEFNAMLTVNTNPLELVFKKLVLAFVALVSGNRTRTHKMKSPLRKSQSSRTLEEHKLLESRVRKVIHDVSPTVVAVESPLGGITKEIKQHHNHFINCGTGVIISSDGLVLSQWHVSHKRADGRSEKIGTSLSIVLHDGRKVKAKLLGASEVLDLSAIQITTPGVYPFLELADKDSAKIGDRVFRIGHPFGYRADRRHVARLGTLIYKGEHVDLVADCQVDGGDSGGPLIDMQGRLLGIAEATSAPFVATWIMSARSGFPFNHHDTSTIVIFSLRSSRQAMQPLKSSICLRSMTVRSDFSRCWKKVCIQPINLSSIRKTGRKVTRTYRFGIHNQIYIRKSWFNFIGTRSLRLSELALRRGAGS